MALPSDEILARLERVRLLLVHAIRVRKTLEGDPERPAARRFVEENVDPGFVPRPAELNKALATMQTRIADAVGDSETRFTRVCQLHHLEELEVDLLLAAIAPHWRRGFRESMKELGPELAPGIHPAAHLIELVCQNADDYSRARGALGNAGSLLRSGLLVAGGHSLSSPLWRGLTPSNTLLAWLEGHESPFQTLDVDTDSQTIVDETIEHALGRLEAQDKPLRICFVGNDGVGKTRAAAALCRRRKRKGIRIEKKESLREALLDCRLRGQILFVTGDASQLADRAFANSQVDVIAASKSKGGTDEAFVHAGFHRLRVPFPSVSAQTEQWRLLLGDKLSEEDLDEMVRLYSLSFAGIEEVCKAALAGPKTQTATELRAAASNAADRTKIERLSEIANRISTSMAWEDLVLSEETLAEVKSVGAAANSRKTVFEDWGYGARMPYGRAISALFSGEPGTGKTMVATLIARDLGLELYRVDLSRLVDKYIGETEKHLAALFDEAENGRCVLLFDEADSLFGKRSHSGDSSNERYSNMEINYLLQRIETFSGIVLLTTNQEAAIDPAFKRRIRYRVEFPFPDEGERASLWQRMLGEGAPIADDVDCSVLGRAFEISGGHIKSAVLRAAFAAADAGQSITQELLQNAATRELENLGKVVRSSL